LDAITQIVKNKLGMGMYTIPDVSVILDIPASRVRHILNSLWDDRFGRKLFHETYSWNYKNINHWEEIIKTINYDRKPFAYKIKIRGKMLRMS
jgi:hypothetical protein